MDNKDIKILKLIFNKATSDGERLNAINFIIKKYGNETVDKILVNKIDLCSNEYLNELLQEVFDLKCKNIKLNEDLYHAKFCAIFWFILMILMGIIYIII